MKGIYFLLFLVFILAGCENGATQQDLQKRKDSLDQREKELLLKENALNLREQELLKQESLLSSSRHLDSLSIIDSSLIARYKATMTCIETTCSGSAVGDTKIEEWDIQYEGNHVVARSMTDNQLNRIYRGQFSGDAIELAALVEAKGGQPGARINVRLRRNDNSSLGGQREIIRENDCKIIYDLKLEKL